MRQLPLRLRLAFFISGLMIVVCLLLTLFINITATIAAPGHLQTVSLIGFALATILGGAGAYWLAGVALQPLKEISQAAHRISASNLDTRLGNYEAADELHELAEAFNAMLTRLELAFKQQGQFVADAAHELRTPLAILRTNLEVIASDPKASLADYQKMTLTLDRAIQRLEHLVHGLLILATGEQALLIEEINIVNLVQTAFKELEATALPNKVKLQFEQPVGYNLQVRGDEFLLAQVFSNLIENAIRYNRDNGKVTIRVGRSSQHVKIEIVDNGIGIETADQSKIFERFYRTDKSRSRNKGGAGLGLAIVQHILEQHNGFVQLESSLGQGSKFSVLLPLSLANFSSNEIIPQL